VAELTVSVPEGRTTLAQFVRTRAGKELEQLLSDIQRRSTIEVTGRLDMGDPCEAILKTAAAGHHDMIVMGTHGRTGLSHLFLGSVAERVVRRAPCPVLTIRSSDVARAERSEDEASHVEVVS
jgi:nucleotide-binding universal stress UspA family protein